MTDKSLIKKLTWILNLSTQISRASAIFLKWMFFLKPSTFCQKRTCWRTHHPTLTSQGPSRKMICSFPKQRIWCSTQNTLNTKTTPSYANSWTRCLQEKPVIFLIPSEPAICSFLEMSTTTWKRITSSCTPACTSIPSIIWLRNNWLSWTRTLKLRLRSGLDPEKSPRMILRWDPLQIRYRKKPFINQNTS